MIRKLRIRFTLVSWGLSAVIILFVLGSSIYNAYRTNQEGLQESMRFAITRTIYDSTGEIPLELTQNHEANNTSADTFKPKTNVPGITAELGGGVPRADSQSLMFDIPTYVVLIDQDNTVIARGAFDASIDEEILQDTIEEISTYSKLSGKLQNYDLTYTVISLSDGTTAIALADGTSLANNMQNLLMRSAVTGGSALFFMLIISYLLARIAVHPVELAWKRERQFIADASHELKTPLAVILANNSIMKSNPDLTASEQRDWLESTDIEGNRMKELLEQMLNLSRSDSAQDLGRASTFENIDLSSLCETSTLQFDSVAYERGVTLNEEIAEGVQIEGDPVGISRLLKILLDNACKYAGPSGQVNFELVTEHKNALIKVTNSGDPIPEEDISHIFERFYRSDKVRTGNNESFGLGLPIAKSIVESHKGTISTTSSPEYGTTFIVKLRIS